MFVFQLYQSLRCWLKLNPFSFPPKLNSFHKAGATVKNLHIPSICRQKRIPLYSEKDQKQNSKEQPHLYQFEEKQNLFNLKEA